MTKTQLSGHHRLGSSRAPSIAHQIIKKRDRPYRTEEQKVLIKRRKLQTQVSHHAPPPGYTFVAYGTPELAQRCKELSRQSGVPVNIVMASTSNRDPQKVSHYAHQLGYHFKADIVEQACEELHYEVYRGRFIKSQDLQLQLQQSHLAAILARHGIRMVQNTQDDRAQIRTVMREIFPTIPEEDVNIIIETSWKEGAGRVGESHDLSLARRIQLAVGARIRHAHTDYDFLLKAFSWREARAMVEPQTLQKLLEWRGEKDDDAEFEEVVRAIVVLNEEDGFDHPIELDSDEDSDATDTSGASYEVTHEVARDDDFGAESLDEAGKQILNRLQRPLTLRTREHDEMARQKIREARQRLRDAPQSSAADIVPVNVQMDAQGLPPNAIVVDGRIFRRASPVHNPPSHLHAHAPSQQYSMFGSHHSAQTTSGNMQPYAASVRRSLEARPRSNVMPSIEPHVPVASVNTQLANAPLTPNHHHHSDKRRRTEHVPSQPYPVPGIGYGQALPRQAIPAHSIVDLTSSPRRHNEHPIIDLISPRRNNEPPVIDLTSPPRHNRSSNPSPMQDVRATLPYHPQADPTHTHYYETPRAQRYLETSVQPKGKVEEAYRPQGVPEPEPYDPWNPLVQFPNQQSYQGAYAPPGQPQQYEMPHATAVHGPNPVADPTFYIPQQPQPYAVAAQYQRDLYNNPQPLYAAPAALPVIKPVHGEPAPIQMKKGRLVAGARPAGVPMPGVATPPPPPPPPPMDGGVHPAQYYKG